MAVKENLQVANNMLDKVKQIQTYSKNYEKVIKIRNDIKKENNVIKENKNYIHKYYESQVAKNEKNSYIISLIIKLLLVIGSCIVVYLLFRGFFASMDSAIAKYMADDKITKKYNFDTLLQWFSIFGCIGLFGTLLYGVWLSLFSDERKTIDNGFTTTLCALWILLKVANLILGIICVVKLMNDLEPKYFQGALWDFIKVAGIGIGIQVAFIIIFALLQSNYIKSFLNKTTLPKAKKADEASFRANKEKLFEEKRQENAKRQQQIDDEFAKFTSSKAKSIIEELEKISPIFCDFYEIKKIDDKEEVAIDATKLEVFSNKLNACIEMIKSGRASDIKEALKEIHKDDVEEEQERLLRQKNAQLFELNEKIDEIGNSYYYDDY